MKRTPPPAENDRFSGNLRHYHRSSTAAPRSWEDWIDGDDAKTPRKGNWPRILVTVVAVLALGGIIMGLAVELS